jgi:hypothetical protein
MDVVSYIDKIMEEHSKEITKLQTEAIKKNCWLSPHVIGGKFNYSLAINDLNKSEVEKIYKFLSKLRG